MFAFAQVGFVAVGYYSNDNDAPAEPPEVLSRASALVIVGLVASGASIRCDRNRRTRSETTRTAAEVDWRPPWAVSQPVEKLP